MKERHSTSCRFYGMFLLAQTECANVVIFLKEPLHIMFRLTKTNLRAILFLEASLTASLL